MDPPTISVVIPAYNRADLLPQTLDAILAQDTPALEVIAVDDGSTDATPAVLDAYRPRVRTLRVPNGGDLTARNTGLRAASGRLVAFCDSDDLWRPGFLSAMAGLWQVAPDLVAAYGNFRLVRDGVWDGRTKFDDAPPGFWDGLRILAPGAARFDGPIVARLLAFQPFFPSAMVVDRAGFLARGGWDVGVSRIVGTDFATALRSAEQPLGIVQDALVGIRKHGGNFSGDVQATKLGEALILEHVLATRPALAPLRAAVLASIADRRAAAADLAFDGRDFTEVRRIQALLPPGHLPAARRVKGWLSRLPRPVALRAASLASHLAPRSDRARPRSED